MILGRLVFSSILLLLGYGVLRELWPSARTWRGAAAYFGVAAVGVVGWALPWVVGHDVGASISLLVSPLRFVSVVGLVTVLILIFAGGPFLVVRRIVWWIAERRARAPDVVDESRRRLLTGAGRAVPMAAVATSTVGVTEGLMNFVVKREEVKVRGLPPGLDGFRIGQLTDVHVGAFITTSVVERAVAMLDREGVDLQVMTGDLIDDLTQLEATIAALGATKARHGMFAIMGNHEYFRGAGPVRKAYAAAKAAGAPLSLLVDESAVIDHDGTPLRIVGVDFPMGFAVDRDDLMRASATAAFAACTPGETTLCLSHHPDFFPHAAERDAVLTLSGHTHGGQMALGPFALGALVFKHALGHYRRSDRHHLYVSGGTGHWLPFRVGVPAEVTVITLRAA